MKITIKLALAFSRNFSDKLAINQQIINSTDLALNKEYKSNGGILLSVRQLDILII